jgi:hypothetical protein
MASGHIPTKLERNCGLRAITQDPLPNECIGVSTLAASIHANTLQEKIAVDFVVLYFLPVS